ncbi:hypothetical protein MOQ_004505 [Trypanosoma cruzi marinkellei]|uniref:Uncharacterized protein n=1 Tax=Trypanosoma cruzi marinkellei TaxID=85056 RepID=K2NRR0_TRYCR|nr:hypothetical protein MOQ_004505 [Trypanosoma cruzi marinkellei]
MTSTSRKMQRCALHFIPCIWIGTLIQETLHHSGESTLRRVVQRRPSTSVRRIQVHRLHWLRGENGVNNANFSRKCRMVQERHPIRIALRDTTPMPHIFLHTCLVSQAAGIIDCFLPFVDNLHGCVACRLLVCTGTHTRKTNKQTNKRRCMRLSKRFGAIRTADISIPHGGSVQRGIIIIKQSGKMAVTFFFSSASTILLPSSLSSVFCFLSPIFCPLLISFPPLFRLFGGLYLSSASIFPSRYWVTLSLAATVLCSAFQYCRSEGVRTPTPRAFSCDHE